MPTLLILLVVWCLAFFLIDGLGENPGTFAEMLFPCFLVALGGVLIYRAGLWVVWTLQTLLEALGN